MEKRRLNKSPFWAWLGILLSLSLAICSYGHAAQADYAQWEAAQKAHDQRLQTAAGAAAARPSQADHYLSKPALDVQASGAKVRLNSATAAQLQDLQGIGQKKAEAIVAYRLKNGKFKSIEEIQQVKGVGPALFAKNKQRLAL